MTSDFLQEGYDLIKDNKVIKEMCEDRIRFYHYETYDDEKKDFIVFRPVTANNNAVYGSNEPNREFQVVQVDVQSRKRKNCQIIMNEIEKEFAKRDWKRINFTSFDSYFPVVGRYVLAYRFYLYKDK